MRATVPTPLAFASVRRAIAALLVALATVALVAPVASATTDEVPVEDEATVEILPVEGYLDPPTARAIEALIDGAPGRDVDLIVLQLSLGASVAVDTAALADRIAASVVPVAVFVGPAGNRTPLAGGALELLAAADVRATTLDARLGPLTPLDVGDPLTDAAATEALARLADRWPEGAALFADDPRAVIVVGEGGTAEDPTDAEDALDRVVPALDAMLAELNGVEVETANGPVLLELRPSEGNVRFQSLSLSGRLLHASTSPAFVYLLLVVGLGMLLFEVFQPGFGVAGFAGVISVGLGGFGLAVFPVAWWAVALVVAGLGLYALDTAMAGFGPVTLAATTAFASGSWFFFDSDVIAVGPVLTILTTLTALVFFVVGMTVILRAQAGPVDVTADDLIGRPGIVRSVLNPEGHVYVDGALWRARWTGEGRRAKVGTPVRVHATDGALVLVEPFEPGPGDATTDTDTDIDIDPAAADATAADPGSDGGPA
jgi:membrane-bound serine protease (ClpP class)